MKISKYLCIAFMAISLASCGSKETKEEQKEIVLNPETTHIKGDLGDYFEVVDREYIPTDGFGKVIAIEVKRNDVDYVFDLTGVEPYGISGAGVKAHAGFGIEILDESGNVISKTAATGSGFSGMYSYDDMKEALKLKAGETGTVRWSFDVDEDQTPVKFRLTSAYDEVYSDSYSSSDDDSDSSSSSSDDTDSDITSSFDDDSVSSSSSSSEDWDSLLDSYEKYVDKYISFAKKAAKGDMSALTEYPALLEKAQEFSSKMSDAQGEMTSKQWTRYMKITNKMATAAQQM